MATNKTLDKLTSFKPKDLINESFSNSFLEVTSLIFKSIDDLNLIIYAKENTLVCYDINNNQKVNEVLKAHEKKISYLNHYSEKSEKVNVMLSLSTNDNILKVWNIKSFDCLYTFNTINNQGWINCACFLNDNNKIYVLSTNSLGFSKKPDPIKVFDLKGNKVKEIQNSNYNTNFIDVYYDNKSSKKYIITGNIGFSNSYDYDNNNVYHKYNSEDYKFHITLIIKEEGKKVELIELINNGKVKIWNFHTGDKLKEIDVDSKNLIGINLWDNNYLLAICGDRSESNIKVISLNNEKKITQLKCDNKELIKVSKIVHYQYGECFVTQGKNGFMLWRSEI